MFLKLLEAEFILEFKNLSVDIQWVKTLFGWNLKDRFKNLSVDIQYLISLWVFDL